jgi:hypothetical protein
MKHGCCADKKCDSLTCMKLPQGDTCGDCRRFKRCEAFLGLTGKETSCDWFPRGFLRSQGAIPIASDGQPATFLKEGQASPL